MVGMKFDDAALIGGARQGSAEALDALYRRYWPIAWQWAYALTGHRQRRRSCAGRCPERVRVARRFDVERPFRPWLKRILLNRAVDELRRLRGALPVDWFDVGSGPGAAGGTRSPTVPSRRSRELLPARRIGSSSTTGSTCPWTRSRRSVPCRTGRPHRGSGRGLAGSAVAGE